ncbi:MAG: cupin domain-containing protein [Anaerolineales bacterium]|nr:cupin domain-containing protein [Anaerolineales bacterium]
MGSVHRQVGKGFSLAWDGAHPKVYEASDAHGVEGQVIIGPHDGDPNYFVRYFRVEPGGQTSLDQHEHDHGVYILHGRAEVLLGDETVELEPQDIVYVSGHEIHQFKAIGSDPLGFLCIVPPH